MSTFTLTLQDGVSSLNVRQISVDEAISTVFSIRLVAGANAGDVDLEAIVGTQARLDVSTIVGGNTLSRSWTGICNQIELACGPDARPSVGESSGAESSYLLTIVPQLWLLSQRTNHRIYQLQSAPDIVDGLLEQWHIPRTWSIDRAAYPQLDYCVQYGETDLDFLHRLLEKAGIAYIYPDAGAGSSTLTLSDRLHETLPRKRSALIYVHKRPDGAGMAAYATNATIAVAVKPEAYGSDDNSQQPQFAVQGHGGPSLGTERRERRSVRFETNAVDLWPGTCFTIDNHPHGALDPATKLLAMAYQQEATAEGPWQATVEAVFTDVPYRPKQTTAKPIASGMQTAMVVGPAGEEVHTDALGRVRVQFRGQHGGQSENWLRVSQGWAGTGFGQFNLPRVGQEVLVGFLEGDPDQPIIVGRVFNQAHALPYTLPEHKTRSTFRSCSSPATGGFNELMIEDLAGKELVYIQAERNLRMLVNHDETVTIGHDHQRLVKNNEILITKGTRTEVTAADRIEHTGKSRTIVVGGKRERQINGNDITRVQGHQRSYVEGSQHLVVGGNRRELIEGDDHLSIRGQHRGYVGKDLSLTVGGDQHIEVRHNHALDAGEEIHISAGHSLVVEAALDLTIKGAGGFIRINPLGVTIKGNLVQINSGSTQAGDGSGAHPSKPKTAKPALIHMPPAPTPDDISKTGLAQ